MYFRRCAFLVAICLALTTSALARGVYNQKEQSQKPQPSVVSLPTNGEAQAAADSNAAGARATAARLGSFNLNNIRAYGFETGKPLLVKPYGELTEVLAAALPSRTFVAESEPVFYQDSYGRIKFQDKSSIAVVAI